MSAPGSAIDRPAATDGAAASAALDTARRPVPGTRPSIRRSLVVWLLVPLALLIPATAFLFYQLALAPALDSLDRSLDGTALGLERLVEAGGADGPDVLLRMTPDVDVALRSDRFDSIYWVVLGPHGRVLGGDAALAMAGTPAPAASWHFQDADYAGRSVRLVVHDWQCVPTAIGPDDGRCQARVAETLNKEHGVQQQVVAAATSAMVVEGLVLVAMGWFAIARSLRPVERLSQDIEQRSSDQLGPVDRPEIPREVAPLVTALNGLFARVVSAAAAEKEFLADAAHQLRTPLTALRTETELALMESQTPQQEALLRRLHMGTTRAARLAHQLLAQARAEHDLLNSPSERFDLKQIAAEAAEEWVSRSVDSGIDLGFELESAPVDGHGFLLHEMLANLLHNALNYAGTGARVTVRTFMEPGSDARQPAHAVLEVEDNGPGIPAQERERVFERFQRGNAGGSGSGLGLAIVRDIVRSHHGQVDLLAGTGGAGLRVRIVFVAPVLPPRPAGRATRGA